MSLLCKEICPHGVDDRGTRTDPVGIPVAFVNTLTEQERVYGLWTSNRSYSSFCTKNDIRYDFKHDSKGTDDKELHVPERFTDVLRIYHTSTLRVNNRSSRCL